MQALFPEKTELLLTIRKQEFRNAHIPTCAYFILHHFTGSTLYPILLSW